MAAFKVTHVGAVLGILAPFVGCSSGSEVDDLRVAEQSVGNPSVNQVPLDPATIPQFAQQLPIPRTFAPTVITQNGQVIRHEYTVDVARTLVQMLPLPLPATNVEAYGGQVKIAGSTQTQFVRSVPGPIFDNTRGIPSLVRWRNEIRQPTFLPVDPTLHWANPLHMEPPVVPFTPFPPGYNNAQFPVPVVMHNHGLVVQSGNDGIATEWFTPSPGEIVGSGFVTKDYLKPNQQPSTALFYHEHAMGMTRVGVYAGHVGTAYYIRDPNAPLDQASSPLPKGEFEVPLVLLDRAFFTDGELNFPRVSTNPANAYWQAGDGANTILVNGAVWPNMNVQRRQYRFHFLAAGNGRTWTPQLDNNGTPVPMTIIGSDGGYLPAPQVVNSFIIGITERADVLIDFSQFAAGTQLTLLNVGGNPANTLGRIMRFTVQNTTPVPPPALNPALFPPKPALPTNAPTRFKTLHNHVDAAGNAMRSVDGLDFTSPVTEFPLVGSTEQWDLLNIGGGGHQIHIHLIEFQVVSRQTINTAAYLQQWNLLNGFKPITRPIVVDPTPFLTGAVEQPPPYDTGWKDTVRSPANQLTRIIARWAPQETPSGGVNPGQNQFPIDPTSGPGYLWHCHVLGHEDNDMMRSMPLVNLFAGGQSYPAGRVVKFQNVDYRVRLAHTSSAAQNPPTRFDLYERVNNNNGTWAQQIIYAIGDRVLHNGQLFEALHVHQATASGAGGPPPSANWDDLPMTACGQLAEFCADNGGTPAGATCLATGQAANEANCLATIGTCLPVCLATHATPCSGLCENPIAFTVPDGANFQSGPLGANATCHETTSELLSGASSGFVSPRQLTVNGVAMPLNGTWPSTLPNQRNHGYCIQTTAGNQSTASFTAF
ncbi:MAG TPA: multicopper oxidase domain-containing protein [Polyangiaceae bacterium]|nr:multicopper oxidase domain-containing protein [Polyangiaceae bacterium]